MSYGYATGNAWTKVGQDAGGSIGHIHAEEIAATYGGDVAQHLRSAAEREGAGDHKAAKAHVDAARDIVSLHAAASSDPAEKARGAEIIDRLTAHSNRLKALINPAQDTDTFGVVGSRGTAAGSQFNQPLQASPQEVLSRQLGMSNTGGTMQHGKAAETAAGRRGAYRAGHALPPPRPGAAPGYPVTDASHWEKAFRAVGRAGTPARRAALARLLRRTAPEFGKTGRIKGSWLDTSGGTKSMSYPMYDFAGIGSDADSSNRGLPGMPNNWNGGEARQGETYPDVTTHSPAGKGSSFQCPRCGYASNSASFEIRADGSAGTSVPRAPDTLRTPHGGGSGPLGSLRDAAGVKPNQALVVYPTGTNIPVPAYGDARAGRGVGRATAAPGPSRGSGSMRSTASFANGRGQGIELARRMHAGPGDIVFARQGGGAVVRHRLGGQTIGRIFRTADGQWGSALGDDGPDLSPHTHQRGALVELLTTHNRSTTTLQRPALPLQAAPAQTPLMQRFGIPAVRSLATPTNGSSDGPRATGNDEDSDDLAGLSPRGVTIYKKLRSRGFTSDRAMRFARRAQNMGA